MKFKAPKGTNDVLPDEIGLWQFAESVIRQVAVLYGYGEIRTPAFESVDLFRRSVGEETDIVNKEMYVFQDRAGREMALRPEGTAPVVRAFIQHRLGADGRETRLFYLGPMFRYERPQRGRCRQFNQFGAELLGSEHPEADVEVICLVRAVYEHLGLDHTRLKINSVGCPRCRPSYHEALNVFLRQNTDVLCRDCSVRVEKNPLRVLDCKREACRRALADAPRMASSLCPACTGHHAAVLGLLEQLQIPFEEDHNLVRGLDYYTRTAFEVIHGGLGAQDAVGGGGRYDGLVRGVDGPDCPAVGYAGGMERLIILLSEQKRAADLTGISPDCFIVTAGDACRERAPAIAEQLRRAGFSTVSDNQRRSMKSQMKTAGKLGVRCTVLLGLEECEPGTCVLRNMDTGQQVFVRIEQLSQSVQTMMEERV